LARRRRRHQRRRHASRRPGASPEIDTGSG
jgi:hypothetical protein